MWWVVIGFYDFLSTDYLSEVYLHVYSNFIYNIDNQNKQGYTFDILVLKGLYNIMGVIRYF